jgi:hypothetical protein
VNVIIEKALQLYFANCSVEVWEKALQGGWLKKLTIRQDKVILENIRSRHIKKKAHARYYAPDFLESNGWKQTFKLSLKRHSFWFNLKGNVFPSGTYRLAGWQCRKLRLFQA